MTDFKPIEIEIPGVGIVWLVSEEGMRTSGLAESVLPTKHTSNKKKELGQILKRLRGSENQKTFAGRVGVGERILREYEKGNEWPQEKKRENLVQELGKP